MQMVSDASEENDPRVQLASDVWQ